MPKNNNVPEEVTEFTQQKPAAQLGAHKTNDQTNSLYQFRALLEGGST